MKTYYSTSGERRVCEIQEWCPPVVSLLFLFSSLSLSLPSPPLPSLCSHSLIPAIYFSFMHFSTPVPSPVHPTDPSQRARDSFTISWRCEVSWWCQSFPCPTKSIHLREGAMRVKSHVRNRASCFNTNLRREKMPLPLKTLYHLDKKRLYFFKSLLCNDHE